MQDNRDYAEVDEVHFDLDSMQDDPDYALYARLKADYDDSRNPAARCATRDGAAVAWGRSPEDWQLSSYQAGACRLKTEGRECFFCPWPFREVRTRTALFDLAAEIWGLTR